MHAFLYDESRIDRIIRQRLVYFICGLALTFIPCLLPREYRIGQLSGIMLLHLCSCGLAFRQWRFESGIWMLAVLMLVLLGPCWVHFVYLYWFGNFHTPVYTGIMWEEFRFIVDGAIALALMAIGLRLAVTVAIENWKRA